VAVFFVLVRVMVEGKCVRTDLEFWRENVRVIFEACESVVVCVRSWPGSGIRYELGLGTTSALSVHDTS
jgi:hypothetical protein